LRKQPWVVSILPKYATLRCSACKRALCYWALSTKERALLQKKPCNVGLFSTHAHYSQGVFMCVCVCVCERESECVCVCVRKHVYVRIYMCTCTANRKGLRLCKDNQNHIRKRTLQHQVRILYQIRTKTDSTQINLNKRSLVNPRSTSNQSSRSSCTVLQYAY